MKQSREQLKEALTGQLQQQFGLDEEAARRKAEDIMPRLEDRFATWVRREFLIQDRQDRRGRPKEAAPPHPLDAIHYERMSLPLRWQHGLMAISVILLIVTGIPLKFKDFFLSKAIIDLLGGIEVSKVIHRVGAGVLIFVGAWHMLYVVLVRAGRKTFLQMIPKLQDARDALQQIKYFLHRTDTRPKFDKYSYVEKFDYWAVYWGMVIMIGSGLVLWFKDQFLLFFPLWATDIAKEAHSDEALLATLAIVIWHFYNVHFNPHNFPLNKTFLTGTITARQMQEEHPLEYERILAQQAGTAPEREGGTDATSVAGRS